MVQTRSGIDTTLTQQVLHDRLVEVMSVHDSLDYDGQTDNAILALKTAYQLTRLEPSAAIFDNTFKGKLLEFGERYEVRQNPVYRRILLQVFLYPMIS